MMKLLIVLPALLLTACSPRASFIPERKELPDAIIGTPYFQKINIIGGAVITERKPIPGKIEPDDNGISMENCLLPKQVITPETTNLFDGNCVEIKGTPVRSGIIKVTLTGMFFGNMYTSGGDFKKTYQINVVAGKE